MEDGHIMLCGWENHRKPFCSIDQNIFGKVLPRRVIVILLHERCYGAWRNDVCTDIAVQVKLISGYTKEKRQ